MCETAVTAFAKTERSPVRPDPSTVLRTGPSIALRTRLVPRPRLIERLNAGLDRKLALISAPTGFGKMALLSEWVTSCQRPVV